MPSRLAVLAIALVLPLAAAHAGTVAEWRQNATTSVAMVDEVMDEVLPPEPSVLKPAGDEIDPEIVEQIEASMEVGPAEEDDDEVYQAPKRRQRASRRDHAQTGVGTKIEDATRVEDQVSVDGKASSACSQSNQIILAPYLQSGSPHRMVVRWRSSGRGRGVVCYGTSPESMTSVAREHSQGWPLYAERKDVDSWDTVHAADHNVEINNLDPHTTYYYAIGTEPEQMPRFETRSVDVSVPSTRYWQFTTFPERMSEQENPVRVWAIGDSGWGDHKAKRVRDAFLNFTGGDWDLTLGLGDLAYLKVVQDVLFQANYYRDPLRLKDDAYLSNSRLAHWNGESHANATWRANFLRTEKFVWVEGTRDTVVFPRDGEHWAAPDPADPWKDVQAMKQTAWYASDAFGLRTADAQGKHAFESFAGQHIDFTDEELFGWLDKYFT